MVLVEDRGATLKTICWECRHLGRGRTCAAFPAGIPLPVWTGEHDHRLPYPSDRGIHFETWTEEEIEARRQRLARLQERPSAPDLEASDRPAAGELGVH